MAPVVVMVAEKPSICNSIADALCEGRERETRGEGVMMMMMMMMMFIVMMMMMMVMILMMILMMIIYWDRHNHDHHR